MDQFQYAVKLAPSGAQGLSFEAAKSISENFSLQWQAAANAMRLSLASMPGLAEQEGLTEGDIARIANQE